MEENMRLHSILGILAFTLTASHAYADTGIKWTYDEDYTGQDEWGGLSKDFIACEKGTQQSPIQISYTEPAALPDLQIHYQESTGHIRYTGHAIEIAVEGDNSVSIDGNTYHLQTIQFHTPGEHTFGDKFYLVELELLHKDANGKILIVSLLGDIGEANSALQNLLESSPKKPGVSVQSVVNLPALLPAKKGYYAYTGSLTSPPCTEGVEWRIFKQPISISKKQLAIIGKLLGRNARLIQPVYMRTVKESEHP